MNTKEGDKYHVREDRIAGILDDYLDKNTNYAMLLTAAWGTGKTHYLQKHYFKGLKERKGYLPVRVSLFGLTSIDDVKGRLLAALYPILGNKWFKFGGNLTAFLIKSADFLLSSADITKLYGPGDVNGLIEGAEKFAGQLKASGTGLNLDKLLICFDDLERLNKEKLSWKELLGYVNSIVEEQNIKVLLVTNEGKMEDEEYKQIKEKTIANSIHFTQDFERTFVSMIGEAEFPMNYQLFLEKNKAVVHLHLKDDTSQVNLRTMKYAMSYFSDIYHFIEKGLEVEDLNEHREGLREQLFLFTLMVSAELKKGEISFNARRELDNLNQYSVHRVMMMEGAETEKNYAVQTISKYFLGGDYNFYGSVFDYVTGGDVLDRNKLRSEIFSKFKVQDGNITPAYKILNRLKKQDYLAIPDLEYRSLMRELRDYALAASYDIWEYKTIFYLLSQDGNLLKLNLVKLSGDLVRVVQKCTAKHRYHPAKLKYISMDKDEEHYDLTLPIYQAIFAANEKAREMEERMEGKWLSEGLRDNLEETSSRVLQSQSEYEAISFRNLDPKDFYVIFRRADNSGKLKLFKLLGYVYLADRHNKEGDLAFLQGLLSLLSGKTLRPERGNSAALYRQLTSLLDKSIKRRTFQR